MSERFLENEGSIEARQYTLSPKEQKVLEMFRIANLLIGINRFRKSHLIRKEIQDEATPQLPTEASSELPVTSIPVADTRGSIEAIIERPETQFELQPRQR